MLYQQAGLSSRLRASGVLVYCNAQVIIKEGARPLCLPRQPITPLISMASEREAIWLRFATRETGHQIYVDAPFPAWI